jgi:hypothetical protein
MTRRELIALLGGTPARRQYRARFQMCFQGFPARGSAAGNRVPLHVSDSILGLSLGAGGVSNRTVARAAAEFSVGGRKLSSLHFTITRAESLQITIPVLLRTYRWQRQACVVRSGWLSL